MITYANDVFEGVSGYAAAEIRQACEAVAAGMSTVGTTVGEMNGLVDGIAAAVDGSSSWSRCGADQGGLLSDADARQVRWRAFAGVVQW